MSSVKMKTSGVVVYLKKDNRLDEYINLKEKYIFDQEKKISKQEKNIKSFLRIMRIIKIYIINEIIRTYQKFVK